MSGVHRSLTSSHLVHARCAIYAPVPFPAQPLQPQPSTAQPLHISHIPSTLPTHPAHIPIYWYIQPTLPAHPYAYPIRPTQTIYTQYNPIYAQLAFLPTPSPVHAPNLPLTCKPPDSSSNICPGDMFLNDFTALHMLLCDVAVFSRLLMIMHEICPCLLYRKPSLHYRNG